MLKLMMVFLASTAFAFDFMYVEDLPVGGGSVDLVYLQYDDGSIAWMTWGGMYRGVWWNVEDFQPGASGFILEYAEWWLYPEIPGDTTECYLEIWTGDSAGPVLLLDRTLSMWPPGCVNYDPPISCGTDFWAVLNTELSAGGWPGILGDGTTPAVNHSFYSDDFLTWEPWVLGDYFIRCEGEFEMGLDGCTWGEIKAIF